MTKIDPRRLAAATGTASPSPPTGGGPSPAPVSQPLPMRPSGLSAGDLPPTAGPEVPMSSRPQPKSGALRYIAGGLVVGGVIVGGYFAWTKVLAPPGTSPVPSGLTASTGTTTRSTGSIPDPTPPPPEDPKWALIIADGQRMLAMGDPEGALKKFKEAQDAGGGAIAKAFQEQVKIGAAVTGPCKLVAFSHPRMGYTGSLGRPSVAATSKGAVVTWTDDHEQARHEHAYSVLLDATGHPTTKPRDLTPEADVVMRPSLLAVDDRVALLYWDKSGREAGVRVRWLDGDGRIDGASVLVSQAKPGDYWPTMDRGPDGFWVAWQEDRDKEGDDIFLRKLGPELTPAAPEIRVTDYLHEKGKGTQVKTVSMAVSPTNVFLGYSIDRDKQKLVMRMRLGLSAPELGKGLEETPPKEPVPGGGKDKRKDRELGETTIVNEDKSDADYPAMACGKDGCFLAWHGIKGGAHAALVDPAKGIVVWRKKFAPNGGHPSLGVSADGQVQVAFYEGGRVRVAALSRDGVGTTSTFGKIGSDQPRPWISPGRAKGEWYVAWLDIEAQRPEVYVARLACRN